MELLQKIEEIIKRDFAVNAQQGAYRLIEENQPDYPETVIRQRGKLLLYSFDRPDSNESVFPFFNSRVADLTTICDYIIFYPYRIRSNQDIVFVFICDLKSNKTSAKRQVESGYVLARYIIEMARKQLRFKSFMVEYRSLVFSLSPIAKPNSNVKPENYVALSGSNLKNKLLKAGSDCYLDNLCFWTILILKPLPTPDSYTQ